MFTEQLMSLQITVKPSKPAGFVKFYRAYMFADLKEASDFLNGKVITVTENQYTVLSTVIQMQDGKFEAYLKEGGA